jgi:hypothetical protein
MESKQLQTLGRSRKMVLLACSRHENMLNSHNENLQNFDSDIVQNCCNQHYFNLPQASSSSSRLAMRTADSQRLLNLDLSTVRKRLHFPQCNAITQTDFITCVSVYENNIKESSHNLTEKMRRNMDKHKLIPEACMCSLNCRSKISEIDRFQFNDNFWRMDYNARRLFLFNTIDSYPVKQRRKKTADLVCRQYTRVYKLNDATVCKRFFMNTLGLKSDKVITVALSSDKPSQDKRGKHVPWNKNKDTL